MSLKFYMDHHVPAAITIALRERGIDVLTALEDGTAEWPDDRILDRAWELERIVFTMDQDFLALAADRWRTGQEFVGIVFAEQNEIGIGRAVSDLELIANACSADELANWIQHLPL